MVIIWLIMINNLVVGIPTPLKNDGVKVSWDDDIPFPINDGKVIIHSMVPVTTNQINPDNTFSHVSWLYDLGLPLRLTQADPETQPGPAHGRWAMGKPDSGQRSPGIFLHQILHQQKSVCFTLV